MKERRHHIASPSALARIELCPGSLELCKKAPKLPPHPAAVEGRMLHEKVPPGQDLEGLSQEQRELVEACRGCLESYTPKDAKVLFEQKLYLPQRVPASEFFNPEVD